jgi:hypothetical protein
MIDASTMRQAKSSKDQMPKIKLSQQEAERLLRAGAELMDAAEDVLEARGAYSEEFLAGLCVAMDEAKKGKLKKIKSLTDLGA